MAKLPISVCMIAKNEEKYIEQCLKSIIKYDMEIVIVDTGSTDHTKQIAAKYVDKVHDFAWIDDFSAARNFAVSKASNNWILILDCDEVVQSIDVPKLRTCMQKYPKSVGVMEIKNVYTIYGKEGIQKESIQPEEVPRFFNRNHYQYQFRIHEQITPKNAGRINELTLETFHIPVIVKHYGYDLPRVEMIKKQERNRDLLLDSIGENEEMDDYLYFQLGQSYSVVQKYEEAIKAYDMCLEINKNPEKKFLTNCLESYADCLLKTGNAAYAYRLLEMNRDYLRTTRLRYLFGKAAHMCSDNETALVFLTGITDAADFERLGEDAFETYARIFAICKASQDVEKLERYKEKLTAFGKAHGKTVTFE